jgi:hypothetical protein
MQGEEGREGQSDPQDPQNLDPEDLQNQEKRNYKTKHQVQIVLTEMERQICEGRTDIEIMKFLEIKERSFYYFKKKLYQQSLRLQTSKKTEEVLTFETKVLKERLTKIYQHLDERLTMINRNPVISDNIAEVALASFQIAKSIL